MPAGDDLRPAAAAAQLAPRRRRPEDPKTGPARPRGGTGRGYPCARWDRPGLPVRGPAGLSPVGDGGGPGADAEFGVDPPDVILYGLLVEEQASGDLPVGLPVRDERHDLDLTCGQPVRLPGAVESGPLASAQPRDLAIVHLTSGCG